MKAPLSLTLSLLTLLFGSAAAADLARELNGGWRTETTLNNGKQQVRQITRLLRMANGRFAGIINHQPPTGQRQPPELPLNVIYYGTWTVTGDQLETAIDWASDKRFAQSSPPLKIVSVNAEQSVFSNGPSTLVRQRHPWTLEAEMARTAELAGFSQDQAQFYKQQADYKPVLGRDRETGVIVLDGDEMPSPNAVKGLSRNQNREAAAQQKLRWLQQAKGYLETGEGNATARNTAAEPAPAPRNEPPPPITLAALSESTPSPQSTAAALPTAAPVDRKRSALRLLGAAVAEDGEILTIDLLKEVRQALDHAVGKNLDELLTELETLKEPNERNRKTFVRYWKAERELLITGNHGQNGQQKIFAVPPAKGDEERLRRVEHEDIHSNLSHADKPSFAKSLRLVRPELAGTVVAWGNNQFGEINVPMGLNDVVAISANQNHTMALRKDGTIVAWGRNDCGQCNVPPGLRDVVAVSAGGAHSLALKSDGSVIAWGNNVKGQANIPSVVTNAVAIAAGNFHSTVILGDESLPFAWGQNDRNQCNIPSGLDRLIAVSAKDYTLGLTVDGKVVSWGAYPIGQASVPQGLGNVVRLAAGDFHSVALLANGSLATWGKNWQSMPKGLNRVASVAAGAAHTVALKADGTVVAWGKNYGGATNVPPALNNVFAITAGDMFTVVLKLEQ